MIINPVPSYDVSLDLILSQLSNDEDSNKDEMNEKNETNNCKGQLFQLSILKWYVLSLYCALAFTQSLIYNTWSPIANSALYIFTSWNSKMIALLTNWSSISFLIFFIPICRMINKKGLRFSFILASSLCAMGGFLRFCSINFDSIFTIFVHLGAILNAIGGVIIGPSVVAVSSKWFPPNQRTTATGIGTVSSQFGMAASYFLGSAVVSDPLQLVDNEMTKNKIKSEILILLLLYFLFAIFLLCIILLTFPDLPRVLPSKSTILSVKSKAEFLPSLKNLLRKKDFWILALIAGLSSGITGPWFSLLTITFSNKGITQNETDILSFWTVLCTCCLSLSISKVADYFPKYLKRILLIFIGMAVIFLLLIFMMSINYIPFNQEFLEVSVMLSLSFIWCVSPIFYEFAVELAYPVPDGIAAGTMMSINNLIACLIYFQMYIPNIQTKWMNLGLVIFNILALVLLLFVNENYSRLIIDFIPD